MGEYVTYKGESIKIGTCEEMYYLRADQRRLIRGYDFSPDVFRYRFPFPDEDGIEPGSFNDYDRGVKIPGWVIPEGYADHGSVQFTATYPKAGYLVSLPCPEQYGHGMSTDLPDGTRIHRNGFNGQPRVVQQRALDGILYTVVACGGCGAKMRLSAEAAVDVAQCFRDEAERQERRRPAHGETYRAFLHGMADRIEAGYLGLDAVEAGLARETVA